MKLLSTLLLCLSASAQYRAVYPYSVMPGGLSQISPAQVEDPVARQAWDGVKALSPACLRSGKYYLQYRRNDEVGWTKEPRQIAAGEPVLVDQNEHILRLRCGNGISSTPRLPLVPFIPPPVAEEEIFVVEWVEPPGMPPKLPLLANLTNELPPLPPFEEQPAVFMPTTQLPPSRRPQKGPFIYGLLPPGPIPLRIAPNPEPATMFLLGGGLVLLILAARRWD